MGTVAGRNARVLLCAAGLGGYSNAGKNRTREGLKSMEGNPGSLVCLRQLDWPDCWFFFRPKHLAAVKLGKKKENTDHYSYLKASIGLSRAARMAGQIPKNSPTAMEKPIASIMGYAVMAVERMV